MLELYINEELIDLSVDQQIAMTYQVSDIGDIRNCRADFSNQFKIPKTKENCRKLGFIDQVTSADMRPYRILPARIIQDGEEIVRNGVCKVLSADESINIVIFSGIKDFFETIGEGLLTDLDLSDLNHTWDLPTIAALMAADSGVCYPLVNYSALPTRGRTVTVNYQFFAIYVKTLFERIFAAAGFEYYGSFFDNPVYENLILPFSNDKYLSPEDVQKSSFTAEGQCFSVGSCDNNYFVVGQPTGLPGCPSIAGLTDIAGNENGVFDGSVFTVGPTTLRGRWKLKGRATLQVPDTFWIKLVSSKKGLPDPDRDGVLWRFKGTAKEISPGVLDEPVHLFSVELLKADYRPGEQLHIEIASSNSNVQFDLKLEFAADEEVVFGQTVDVARNLPKIKQRDFLKAIAHMFGLIFEQDENIQRVRIRPFDEIQTNKGASIDWSDKLHVPASKNDSRSPQVFFNIGYAQANNFKYKEDEGVTPGYGDGQLLVDNQNLEAEKTIIDLPFAATEAEDMVAGSLIGQIPQFEEKEFGEFTPEALPYDSAIDYHKDMYAIYEGRVFKWINDASSKDFEFSGISTPPVFIGFDDPVEEDAIPESATFYEQFWQLFSIEFVIRFERTFKTEPRIMVADRVDASIELLNDLTGVIEIIDGEIILPYFIKAGGEFNLGFADSLLAENYKTIADITLKTKFVKAHFNLSGNDVKNIDYLIPRYVSYFGAFFYINRIEKFMKGRTTLVHLVRV